MNVDYHTAVETLQERYRRLPTTAPVQLRKPTSNLFRPRRAPRRGSGLDTSEFQQVFRIDPRTRTAEVGGMTTYEDLVDATLEHGLLPPVVLDLRTITLGGAVAGIGAESSSFRAGMPHDPVTAMDILTGDGNVVSATRDNEHADLFHGLPHSYGSLGYALRLTIDLDEAKPYVRLRHVRTGSLTEWLAALRHIADHIEFDGTRVDFVDGAYFAADAVHLVLGTFTDDAPYVSDYTRQRVYHHSIRQRSEDYLTTRDYLWRWDTDLYWTSRLFGLENPVVRALWPRRLRNSRFLRRVHMLDRRLDLTSRAKALVGRPCEWVVQDADLPAESVPEFMRFFDREIGIKPVWLCPMLARTPVSLYPMETDKMYVSVGFWWPVPRPKDQAPDHYNKIIEREITALGGLKPLYSTTHYGEEEFWQQYGGGGAYQKLKDTYDPDHRLASLYDKCVRAV
jgi:FAD/FMN-containing dehydrogenase